MIMIPAATLRWSLQNGRSLGVGAAFVGVLVLRANGEATFDLLTFLAALLPAIEVVMIAATAAFYFDSVDEEGGAETTHDTQKGHGVEAMIAWFVIVFALTWGNIALVRVSIDAYTALGVPPAWDVMP
ncbi:MAG: hypothetical protein Q7S99_08090 [Parvibaculum sp.]|mgnify:CR=1 FL=1|nr:hypothetical protein [Parvibaculum sp.]